MKAASRALAMDPDTAQPWTCNGVVLRRQAGSHDARWRLSLELPSKRILLDMVVHEYLSLVEDHLRDSADANPF